MRWGVATTSPCWWCGWREARAWREGGGLGGGFDWSPSTSVFEPSYISVRWSLILLGWIGEEDVVRSGWGCGDEGCC